MKKDEKIEKTIKSIREAMVSLPDSYSLRYAKDYLGKALREIEKESKKTIRRQNNETFAQHWQKQLVKSISYAQQAIQPQDALKAIEEMIEKEQKRLKELSNKPATGSSDDGILTD